MIKAQLFAMGTQRELLSTQLTYHRTANPKTGRSGPIPMGGLVTLAFASGDGDDRLLRWITHSPEGELCTLTTAKIVFYEGDPDGSTLFAYRLHDAALVHWKEEFKATGTTPMMVTITISAAIQEIKGITWVKPWRESAVHKEDIQRGISDDHGKKEDDGSALEGVVLEVAKSSFKSFSNLDDLGRLFKNKSLTNASDDLLHSRWKKLEGNWGSRTVFEKQIRKQKYYAQWEVNAVHSTTNQPVGYWKLTYGKINATSKNTIRVSPSSNFKP